MSGWKGMKRRKVEDGVEGGPDGMTCGRSGTGMTTVQVIVPANKTGLVIGKGGENIRQINLQSQAHIEIQRNLPSDQMYKTFIIRGTPNQIVLAQQLIQEKIGGDGTGGPPDMHMGPLGPGGPHGALGGLAPPPPQGNFGRPTTSPKFHGPWQGPPQQAQPPQQFQGQQSCSEAPNQYQSPQPNAAQQNEPAPQDPSTASAGPSETRSASDVQETLPAPHVAELPLEDFQSFVTAELLRPRMEVVRRFLFGILFSDISNKSSKMEHLKNWLNETYIPQEEDGQRLCRLLNECGSMIGDVCNGHLPRLDYGRLPSKEDEFALASVLRAVSVIDELSIYDTCHLKSTTLSALAENVMKIRNLQVLKLGLADEDDEPQCDAFVQIARHATYQGYNVDLYDVPKNVERWLEVMKNKGLQFLPIQVSVDCATIAVEFSDPENPLGDVVEDVPVNMVQSHFLKWLKWVSSDEFGCWGVKGNLRIKSTAQGQVIFAPSYESSQDSTP